MAEASEKSYRVQYFGRKGQWVWTRRHVDFDNALQIAKRWASEKSLETRVWVSNAQSGESLVCYVSPDGSVVDRRSPNVG
jgi:hypothetical protein